MRGSGTTSRTSAYRRTGIVAAVLSSVALGGCSAGGLFSGSSVGALPYDSPVLTRTLDPRSAWLRHYLMLDDPGSALDFLENGSGRSIDDPLLRNLEAAMIARSGHDFVRSNALLEEAEIELERRKVLSVSQTAGSYLVSERLLSYLPATGEEAMIPFYRMMNYLSLGDIAGAAIEARRVSAFVDAVPDDALGGCREVAMLNYTSGLIFESAAELNDAMVSLRRANESMRRCEVSDPSLAQALHGDISRVALALGIDDLELFPADDLAINFDSNSSGEAAWDPLNVAHRVPSPAIIPPDGGQVSARVKDNRAAQPRLLSDSPDERTRVVPVSREAPAYDTAYSGSADDTGRRPPAMIAAGNEYPPLSQHVSADSTSLLATVSIAGDRAPNALLATSRSDANPTLASASAAVSVAGGTHVSVAAPPATLAGPEVTDGASGPARLIAEGTSPTGELLVLLEHGFIAHRAEGVLHIPLFEDEIEDLESDDAERIAEVAAIVTARLLENVVEKEYYGGARDDQPIVQLGQSLSGAHIIRLAWPELHDGGDEPARLRVVAGADTVHASVLSDLSDIAGSNLASDRAASLTRLVSRAITRFLASQAIEAKAEKEGGELLGFVAGRLSNLAANATERADTRSWTLLPDQISFARLTLPAGERKLEIQSYDPRRGEWRAVDLGRVVIEPGGVVVVSRRIWSDAPPTYHYDDSTEDRSGASDTLLEAPDPNAPSSAVPVLDASASL